MRIIAKLNNCITHLNLFCKMPMDEKLSKWVSLSLETSGYPFKEIQRLPIPPRFDFIINVSDEYYCNHHFAFVKCGVCYCWFPLGQSSKDIGLSSLFGALHTLYQCYKTNKTALVHCRKGTNRSLIIYDAFFYMMNGFHFESKTRVNMLIKNCTLNHLPDLGNTEKWLSNCKLAFENYSKFKGNMFDWVNYRNE